MKHDRIPTRRGSVRKTFYARLFNRAKPRKQRASAAAASAEEIDGGGINISRSLTIIFAIHILAIGMIFIHKQYLSGRTKVPEIATKNEPVTAVVKAVNSAVTPPLASARNNDLPILSSGDKPYMVEKGDNYSIIARKQGVDESELRNLNRGADIRAGAVLRIPQGKRIIAEDPPEVAAIRNHTAAPDTEQGLVEIVSQPRVEQPKSIRPANRKLENSPRVEAGASGHTHTVKSGENIWRISNQHKVSQKELLAINGISDPSKLKIGQVLKLP